MARRRSGSATAAGEYSTVAALVAKFTDAETTPGVCRSAFSMAATQDAQEIPPIGIVTFSTSGAYPASAMAFTNAAGCAAPGSYWTLPRSAAKLTTAVRTPGTAARASSTAETQEAQCIPRMPMSRRAAPRGAGGRSEAEPAFSAVAGRAVGLPPSPSR